MSVLRLVRRLASMPGVRLLTRVDALLRLSFALGGYLVRARRRFALHDLVSRPGASTYLLRGAPVKIAIRHGTPDVMVLDEIFSQREYEFPDAVLSALHRVGPRPRVADLG